MARVVTVLAFLLVAVTLPIYVLLAGYSPALMIGKVTEADQAMSLMMIGLILSVPFWVFYYGWQSIKAWRGGGSIGAAVAMAVPAAIIMSLFIFANFYSTAN